MLRVGAGYEFGIGQRVTVGPYASVGRLAFDPDETRTFGSVSSAETVESERIVQYGLALHRHP